MKTKILAALLFTTGVASANGFVINEHDAASTGRGNATVATNDTPSSIVFNPGGIAVGKGTSILINGTMISSTGSYEAGGQRTETDTGVATLPAIYVTSRVHDYVSVGIGFHLPFGAAISWPEGHAQQGTIQDQQLRTYFITPVVGLNLNKIVPGLSIGGGVDLVPSTILLERKVVFGETVGNARLGGDAFGVGARVGVQYRPAMVEGLSLGAMWRSEVKLDYEGKGDFDIDPALRGQLPPDGAISSSVTLPQSVGLGIGYKPASELEFEVNAIWMGWSSFKDLTINLPDDSMTVAPQNYEDKWTYRVGVQYNAKNVPLSLRLGYVYDPTPIPGTTVSAQLPDADRNVLTAGASVTMLKDYTVSLGLLTVLPSDQVTSDADPYQPAFKGTYEVQAFVASLSFNGRFGAN